MNDQQRYIIENGVPGAPRGANDSTHLNLYLNSDPHPSYRLVTCDYRNGSYFMVWEKRFYGGP
jgi:hypothetical protein